MKESGISRRKMKHRLVNNLEETQETGRNKKRKTSVIMESI
jgi:hypothetical protein